MAGLLVPFASLCPAWHCTTPHPANNSKQQHCTMTDHGKLSTHLVNFAQENLEILEAHLSVVPSLMMVAT
jgi:hypothetical protein